jgi:hypothetical protein
MHWQDLLIALPLAALLVWAIVHTVRRRRNGSCCCGGDCSACRSAHTTSGKTSSSSSDRPDTKADEQK